MEGETAGPGWVVEAANTKVKKQYKMTVVDEDIITLESINF